MIIEGGTGKKKSALVTEGNRLAVAAITSTIEHFANHNLGLAYNVSFSQSPTAGDDCIFYMKNSDPMYNITIEGFYVSVSAACEVYFKINDKGTRNSATSVVPVNLNGGSGNVAIGDFEYGADLDGGAATLAGGLETNRFVYRAASNTEEVNFAQDVVLPVNSTLTVWCSSAAPTVTMTLIINYHGGIMI